MIGLYPIQKPILLLGPLVYCSVFKDQFARQTVFVACQQELIIYNVFAFKSTLFFF
jgi:hypothetical protein